MAEDELVAEEAFKVSGIVSGVVSTVDNVMAEVCFQNV